MHLDSFQINGFRAFNKVQFQHFSDVNLLVGKNNVGKTTVLEALRIYLTQDALRISDLLSSRDEYSFRKRRRRLDSNFETPALSFESLFFGRPNLSTHPAFSFGPLDDQSLKISFTWIRRIHDDVDASIRYVPEIDADADIDPDVYPAFSIEFGTNTLVPLDRFERIIRRRPSRSDEQSIVYLPSSGMSSEELGKTWDSVALTEDENVIIDTLKCIVPTLEKLVLVQSPNGRTDRLLMAKLSEFSEPVPFKSLGDGVLHLLNLVLALLNARNGVLLADEVENGLHYTMQEDMWEIILKQAKAWSVQVFATTHSWDCVRGLQEASALPHIGQLASASLFRLEKIGSSFKTTSFSPDELRVAQHEDIEVR